MDVQLLINEVYLRPAIWDQKNMNYHNREAIHKMWIDIAKICEVSVEIAKSKWKHLRDNFRNELKKCYRSRTSADSSPTSGMYEYDSKWVWFKSLHFLTGQMNSRVIAGFGPKFQGQCSPPSESGDSTVQMEPQIVIFEDNSDNRFEEVDEDSLLAATEDSLPSMPPPKASKTVRKRTFTEIGDDEDSDFPEVDRKRFEPKQLIAHEEIGDDVYHFLMSLRNPLKTLPLDRQLFVRLKIQELIFNEINNLNQQVLTQNDPMVGSVKPEVEEGGPPEADRPNSYRNCATEDATEASDGL